MSKTRIGVIGVGHLGRIHARLASELQTAELVAVVDCDPHAAEKLAAEHHVAHCGDYQQIVNGIDAAVIATPTRSHFEIAKDLLEQGVHVLVEKPMTHTSSQARHLVSLAQEKNLVLQVGHVERFNPVFELAAQQVSHPAYIESQRTSSYTFRSTDIGVVHDLMIHDIDLVLSLNRCDVTEISALGASVFGGHEDMAQARIEFANGCVANLTASRTSFTANRAMNIVSREGFWGLDFATGTLKTVNLSDEVRLGTHGFASMSPQQQQQARDEIFTRYLPLTETQPEKQNAILNEQQDFITSIRNDSRPRVTAQDGCRAVEVCDLILQQIATRNRTAKTHHDNTMPTIVPLPARKAA